jgi:hypothetical protein
VPTHILRTPHMEIGVERGVIHLLVNRKAGETFSVPATPPLTGVRHLKSGEVWNDRPQVEHRLHGQELLVELRWREQGTGNLLQTRLRAQPEGDVLVTQKADCTLPGLIGLQWGLVIPDSCELLVPGYSGLRLSADSDFQPMQFNYPMEWEAQFVLIQGKRGGFLIYAEDNAERFKRLFVQHRSRQFWVGFETWCTAPFDKIQQAESVRWRIRAYSGSWLHGAAMYRQWAEETFGLAALRRTQPGWVDDIQTVIIDNGDDMDKMRALAERLNPRQTLLYIPDWRRDGYDRNYPDYTPREDFPQRMEQARRLGFRIMLHVNYFGCTPENPVYEQMKPYHFRDPFRGEPLYWDWQRADPPIKFAYINPAAKAWRELFVKRMVELCRLLKPDALHLDQTLCIYNDRNGIIDGMNAMQGNLALHRELRDALPEIALSGEGLNEVSFRYEQFAQRHVWGINAADSKADMRYVRMAHPVSSSLLVPHTRLYGYLGMVSPQMWQLYVAWRTAYERFGVLPTFGWLSREQATQPDTVMQIFWGEARWFQQHRPVPDYTPARWDAHTLFAYRTADGGTARYRREPTGVCLEAQKGGMRRIVARRIEGVTRAQAGGSIPHWLAYNERGMLGLNPDASYVWVSTAPDLNALHVHEMPENLMLAAATVQQPEWARFAFEPREEAIAVLQDLRENIRYAVAGKVGEGYIVEHETGAVARPYGDGIFMHPPYRRDVGKSVWLEYTLTLPADRTCVFRSGVGYTSPDAAQRSDGITFTVTAFGARGSLSAKRHVTGNTPQELTLNLGALRGQRIRLRLGAHPGPKGSPDFDWGYWTRPRVAALPTQQMPVEVYSPQQPRLAFLNGAVARWQSVAARRYRFLLPPEGGAVTLLYAEPKSLAVPADLTQLAFQSGLELQGAVAAPTGFLQASVGTGVCSGVAKRGFSAHPPPHGKSYVAFLLRLPSQPVVLRGFAGIRDGAEGKSNGVRFSVEVNGKEMWNRTVLPGEGWITFEVPLSQWQGQVVLLRLVGDSLGDYGWDWAHWGEVRIE